MNNFDQTTKSQESQSNTDRNINNIFSQDNKWEQKEYLNHQIQHILNQQLNLQCKQNQNIPNQYQSITNLFTTKNLQIPNLNQQCQLEKSKNQIEKIQKYNKYKQIFKPSCKNIQKNTNVSKYFMRQFIMNFGKQQFQQFANDSYLKSQVRSYITKQKRLYSQSEQNKNINNNLDALNNLFGVTSLTSAKASCLSQQCQQKYSQLRSFKMRKIAHRMIRQKLIPEVFKSSQIRANKKTYIYTLKVQMLRCQNAQLIKRTQIA